MNKKKHVIISGIQGSGKGTQARLLEKKFGWVHIGTGALCRWHLTHRTTYGKELKAINQGSLAADDLMKRLLERRLEVHNPEYEFLLDGFPRNKAQMEYLFERYDFKAVVFLDLDQEFAMQRAQSRVDGKQVRKDDNEAGLKRRFELFYEHTEPLTKIYADMGILHRVNAKAPIETVQKRIVDSLEKVGIV